MFREGKYKTSLGKRNFNISPKEIFKSLIKNEFLREDNSPSMIL